MNFDEFSTQCKVQNAFKLHPKVLSGKKTELKESIVSNSIFSGPPCTITIPIFK